MLKIHFEAKGWTSVENEVLKMDAWSGRKREREREGGGR